MTDRRAARSSASPPGPLRWFDADDGRMPYLEFGAPDAPPMLLLPGLADGLAPLSEPRARAAVPAPPAALARHRMLLLSHRHPLPPTVSTADLAEDVIAFLDAVVGEAAVISGHSMGAMVAQHVAARYPDAARRLVLSATVPSADDHLRRRIGRWDELITAGRWRDFYRDALAVSYTGSDRLRRQLALRFSAAPALDHLVDRHLALSHACRTHDARAALGAITAPTLVLAGAEDPLARPERARELAAAVPDTRLLVLPGLAHGFPEQAGRRYVRHVDRFLRLGDAPT